MHHHPIAMPTASRVARSSLLLAAAALAAGCASTSGNAGGARNAQLLSTNAPATCSEWVARAVASPELDVERVPEPVAYDPRPVPRRMPPGVAGRDGVAEIRIKVLVDTLGKADMRTFQVVRSTHPSLTQSARNAVAKWKFRPAMVGGCKVPRTFNWGATASLPATPKRKSSRS